MVGDLEARQERFGKEEEGFGRVRGDGGRLSRLVVPPSSL